MANYSNQKSHWGGVPGTIQIHTVPGLGINNDPNSAVFKENLPAGFLLCDGKVLNAKDFLLLSRILGVGEESRFKKNNVTLREADPDQNDLGQFQLPDLGSKVIIGGRGSGEYRDTTMTNQANQNKVGIEVTPISNLGERINVNYISNIGDGMKVTSQTGLNFRGNIKYSMQSNTNPEVLSIEQFQAHAHNMGEMKILNHTEESYAIDGDGLAGDIDSSYSANVQGINYLDEVQPNVFRGEATHFHRITKPTSYSSNFTYSFPGFNLPVDDMESYIDVDTSNLDVLNQVVTPFMMVQYIIKF